MGWLERLKNVLKSEHVSTNENVEIVTQVTPINDKLVIVRPLTRNCKPEDPYPLKIITRDGKMLDTDTLKYIDSNIGNEYVDGMLMTVIYDIYHMSIDDSINDNIVAVFSTGDRTYGIEILMYS